MNLNSNSLLGEYNKKVISSLYEIQQQPHDAGAFNCAQEVTEKLQDAGRSVNQVINSIAANNPLNSSEIKLAITQMRNHSTEMSKLSNEISLAFQLAPKVDIPAISLPIIPLIPGLDFGKIPRI